MAEALTRTAADVKRALRRPAVSILVPAHNEAENLPLLLELTGEMIRSNPATGFELIVIDDGSTDGSADLLARLERDYPFLRTARHRIKRGIAEALRTGYLSSRGEILVFYPADLQYRPEDIPALVAPIIEGKSDVVAGYKQGKYEKAFVSGIYNKLSRLLFALPVRDLNSVKAYRREVMEGIPARPDWHRYMVAIAAAQGFSLSEVPVPLYPRHAGRSKFGLRRIPVGVLDMLSVWFELRFAKKPLLLFGMLGAGLFAAGVIGGVAAILWRFVIPAELGGGRGFRPLIDLVQTCIIVGSVFLATGLLGEQIAGQRAEVNELRRRIDEMNLDGTNTDRTDPGNEI